MIFRRENLRTEKYFHSLTMSLYSSKDVQSADWLANCTNRTRQCQQLDRIINRDLGIRRLNGKAMRRSRTSPCPPVPQTTSSGVGSPRLQGDIARLGASGRAGKATRLLLQRRLLKLLARFLSRSWPAAEVWHHSAFGVECGVSA